MNTALRHGVTLLEVVVAGAILSTVLFTVSQAMKSGTEVVTELSSTTDRTARASSILHELAMELRSADKDFMYDTDGDPAVFSYQVCSSIGIDPTTGLFKANYDESVVISYDKSSGLLTKDVTLADGDSYEVTLADNVAPDGFEVLQMGETDTINGHRLKLELTLRDEDVNGQTRESTASRYVFIRSYIFNSDGVSGASMTNDGSSTSDGTGGTTDETTSAPDPIHETGGPNMEWGDDQSPADADQILVVVQLTTGQGAKLVEEKVLVEFIGDTYSNMEVTYGWNANSYGLQKDEIRIAGNLTGSLGITITAQAKSGNTYATTRETNFY